MVLRSYQVCAVEAIAKRVQDGTRRNGYIWHTTGSGKTLTSFKTAQVLTRASAQSGVRGGPARPRFPDGEGIQRLSPGQRGRDGQHPLPGAPVCRCRHAADRDHAPEAERGDIAQDPSVENGRAAGQAHGVYLRRMPSQPVRGDAPADHGVFPGRADVRVYRHADLCGKRGEDGWAQPHHAGLVRGRAAPLCDHRCHPG